MAERFPEIMYPDKDLVHDVIRSDEIVRELQSAILGERSLQYPLPTAKECDEGIVTIHVLANYSDKTGKRLLHEMAWEETMSYLSTRGD